MAIQHDITSERKTWQEPKLEQLTVDLTAVAQRRSGSSDARAVGAVS